MKPKSILLIALFIATMITRSFSEITITFNVDVAGATVSPGGMHLAGQFASDGSTSLPYDWTPAQGAMTFMGGTTWSLAVTFPSSYIGYPLQFLFVRDSIWGDYSQDYSEGNPGMTALDYSCGTSDPYGGFNRLLYIPSSNAVLSAGFDHCGTLNTCPLPTNLNTTNITSSSAQLNWSPVNAGTNYKIRYRKIGGNWSTITVNGINNTSTTLNGLLSSTSYQWQMRTACTFGPSLWTSKISFTTSGGKLSSGEEERSLSIYPNPASEKVSVRFNLQQAGDVMIEVNDLTGSIVKSFSFPAMNSGDEQVSMNVSDLSAGNYFVTIKSNSQLSTTKLSISK